MGLPGITSSHSQSITIVGTSPNTAYITGVDEGVTFFSAETGGSIFMADFILHNTTTKQNR